jgi:hypothetical protein
VLAAGGCGGTETTTVERTVTTTTVVTAPDAAATLPRPAAKTWAALREAAASGDYEQLRPLVTDRLSYTFGEPVDGGAVAYWRQLEAGSDTSPLRILAALLKLPYTLYRGAFVWPFAFDKQPDELTAYELGLLRSVDGQDLSDDFGEGTGYLGWRVGIEPDGDWVFFIAGD